MTVQAKVVQRKNWLWAVSIAVLGLVLLVLGALVMPVLRQQLGTEPHCQYTYTLRAIWPVFFADRSLHFWLLRTHVIVILFALLNMTAVLLGKRKWAFPCAMFLFFYLAVAFATDDGMQLAMRGSRMTVKSAMPAGGGLVMEFRKEVPRAEIRYGWIILFGGVALLSVSSLLCGRPRGSLPSTFHDNDT